MQSLTSAGHHQLSMFDPLEAQDRVGDGLDCTAPALHNDYLQAVVMIEVYVSRGKHLGPRIVLHLDELFGEVRAMEVVDNGQRPGDYFVLVGFARNQVVANEVA